MNTISVAHHPLIVEHMRFMRKSLSSPRQRQRKIDRIFRNIAECILVSYFLFVVGVLLFAHPFLRITNISVVGTRSVDATVIATVAREVLETKLLWKIERGNAFFLPRNRLITKVKDIDRRIASVALATPSLNDLLITVEEYIPAFIWCPLDGDHSAELVTENTKEQLDTPVCYFADRNGLIFDDAPRFSGTALRVYRTEIVGSDPIGRHILPAKTLTLLEGMAEELQSVGIFVFAIESLGSGDYRLTVNAPWVLLWSETKDPKASVENLALAIQELRANGEDIAGISSIDLRFGDKVFYR